MNELKINLEVDFPCEKNELKLKLEVDFPCEKCDKSYETRKQLKDHTRNIHGVSSNCEVCGKTFLSKKQKQKHVKGVHQRDVTLRFPCNICGKEYRIKRQLNIHLIKHITAQNNQKSRNICNYCNQNLCKRKDLEKHLKEIHLDETNKDYNECTKCFRLVKIISFELHKASCDPDKRKLEKTCSHCKYEFKRRGILKEHQRQGKCITRPIDPLRCPECDKSFRTKEMRRKHKYVIHGDNMVECPDCGESFNRLNRSHHLKSMVHRGVPPQRGLPSLPVEGSEGWREVWGEVSRYTSSTRRAGEGVRREAWARLGEVLPGLDQPLRFTKGVLGVVEVLTEEEEEEMVRRARVSREQMEVVLRVVGERLGLGDNHVAK